MLPDVLAYLQIPLCGIGTLRHKTQFMHLSQGHRFEAGACFETSLPFIAFRTLVLV